MYGPVVRFPRILATGVKCLRLQLPLAIALSLCACSSNMSALVQSTQKIIFPGAEADKQQLRSDVTYLRVTLGRHVALMGLLTFEPHANGQVEVWIGAGGEVLRLQSGRVQGVSGLPVEWRQVSLPLFPSWSTIEAASAPYQWSRARDVMPGYRSGVNDRLALRLIDVPRRSQVRGYEAATLKWFEERPLASQTVDSDLPPARYAVEYDGGKETVVYAEQCLSREVCLTWQHWYVALQQAARK
jgi:hypothetical protein